MSSRLHHPLVRVFHWATATMVIAALGMSTFVMSQIPAQNPEKLAAAVRHMSVGLLICLSTLARLYVRRRAHKLPALSSGMVWADALAWLVHRSLDWLVLSMILSGITMALMSDLPAIAWAGGSFPAQITSLGAYSIHVVSAILLSGALALHIGGALYHQFILRDGLLARMGLGEGEPRRSWHGLKALARRSLSRRGA